MIQKNILRVNKITKKLLNIANDIAIDIIKVSNILKSKKEHSFADQIKRSGTSISANIAEANYPQSKLDMISKFEIALKEANETENWLNIFLKSQILELADIELLRKKIIKTKILLIASIKTLKKQI